MTSITDTDTERNDDMKRKLFSWHGYRYAPESFYFSYCGKPLNLPSEKRSDIGYLIICGNKKEAEDELKRYVRRKQKTSKIAGKCIAFFCENSNEFYFTQNLMYKQGDMERALYCYKEWKRYIIEKNCYIDVGYELTQGEFSPLGDGENVTSKQKICRKVDLSRGKIIKIFYPDSQVYI